MPPAFGKEVMLGKMFYPTPNMVVGFFVFYHRSNISPQSSPQLNMPNISRGRQGTQRQINPVSSI
jgi:hypothetical protein